MVCTADQLADSVVPPYPYFISLSPRTTNQVRGTADAKAEAAVYEVGLEEVRGASEGTTTDECGV